MLFPVSKAARLSSWTPPSSFKTNSISTFKSLLLCSSHCLLLCTQLSLCLTLISTLVTAFGAHPDNTGSCSHFRILNLVYVFILFCHIRSHSQAPAIRTWLSSGAIIQPPTVLILTLNFTQARSLSRVSLKLKFFLMKTSSPSAHLSATAVSAHVINSPSFSSFFNLGPFEYFL